MPKQKKKQENPLEIKCSRVAKTIIRRALKEDLRDRGDITTRAIVPVAQTGSAFIISKADGVIAGQKVAAGVFEMLDKSVKYKILIPDGASVAKGTKIAQIIGKMWVILAGERTALNILGRCGGVATFTNKFVQAVEGTGARITETRKTAPGLRYLDKGSVIAGGGVNHRYGLWDAFLIKENHIAAIGGIVEAINACQEYSAKYGRFKVMVEAEDFDEFKLAVSAAPDRILLDNMDVEQIKRCVEYPHETIELEATGGINLNNVRSYAETGVDFISLGTLTHSVVNLDLSLLVETKQL